MYLNVSDRQFGFKKNLSCSNAAFVLHNIIEYFNERSSSIFLASDHVNHFQLYYTLMKKAYY